MGLGQGEQALQVDDLVVAPVTEVGPGVVGFGDFPIHAFGGDAVGVVAVGAGGIEEGGEHARKGGGETQAEGFPVLEDVAPVALPG